MARKNTQQYSASDWGKDEEKMMVKYFLQKDDAYRYFEQCIKPRLDRSYKLYIAYNGDRAKEIKKWQSNIAIPYIQAVVETMMPRILDARPEFMVQGRSADDQLKAPKVQQLNDYTWEIAHADKALEDGVRSSMTYGTGFLQTSWKKDVRERKFLKSTDILKKKLVWEKRKETFYDAPYLEWVDNYSLWYDWHNVPREEKQYWFKRKLMTGEAIKRIYNFHDKDRIELALNSGSKDLTSYDLVRQIVKLNHDTINKGDDRAYVSSGVSMDKGQDTNDPDLQMHEVFEWLRPHDDEFAVMVNDVPILSGGSMPNIYNFKETNFIDIPYLRLPNEFEGYGIPMILESPQIMLNMMKNQRLDNVTLSIHKMWIVNPLANIRKEDLVTRPFGIIYSPDPNGVKEVQFGDIKQSAYKEEELLKSDMRYASGVDDFSMGVGGGAGSATEIRHLRESTLERVRLFVNHLGEGLSHVLRHWISMYGQFFTDDMIIRIIGDDGKEMFPLIQRDDVKGEFDFRALVNPSIAGQNDIEKKQGMDLFQLLVNLPFIDQRKLTAKVLRNWNWNLESITTEQQEQPQDMSSLLGGSELAPESMLDTNGVPLDVAKGVMSALGSTNVKFKGEGGNPFAQLANPLNLLQQGGPPPTAKGIPTSNPRGLNMSGKPNTNINQNQNSNPLSSLLNRVNNIQK